MISDSIEKREEQENSRQLPADSISEDIRRSICKGRYALDKLKTITRDLVQLGTRLERNLASRLSSSVQEIDALFHVVGYSGRSIPEAIEIAEILGKVLDHELPWHDLPAKMPEDVERLVDGRFSRELLRRGVLASAKDNVTAAYVNLLASFDVASQNLRDEEEALAKRNEQFNRLPDKDSEEGRQLREEIDRQVKYMVVERRTVWRARRAFTRLMRISFFHVQRAVSFIKLLVRENARGAPQRIFKARCVEITEAKEIPVSKSIPDLEDAPESEEDAAGGCELAPGKSPSPQPERGEQDLRNGDERSDQARTVADPVVKKDVAAARQDPISETWVIREAIDRINAADIVEQMAPHEQVFVKNAGFFTAPIDVVLGVHGPYLMDTVQVMDVPVRPVKYKVFKTRAIGVPNHDLTRPTALTKDPFVAEVGTAKRRFKDPASVGRVVTPSQVSSEGIKPRTRNACRAVRSPEWWGAYFQSLGRIIEVAQIGRANEEIEKIKGDPKLAEALSCSGLEPELGLLESEAAVVANAARVIARLHGQQLPGSILVNEKPLEPCSEA
nr:hypothetical protein [Candidatus Sigynarchaeum springense]